MVFDPAGAEGPEGLYREKEHTVYRPPYVEPVALGTEPAAKPAVSAAAPADT